MFESLHTTLIEWNQRTTDRQKLQHTYVALLAVVIFAAGLISLFDANRSRQVVIVALALITTFVVNFLVWGLLKSTLLDKLPRQSQTTRRTATTPRTTTSRPATRRR